MPRRSEPIVNVTPSPSTVQALAAMATDGPSKTELADVQVKIVSDGSLSKGKKSDKRDKSEAPATTSLRCLYRYSTIIDWWLLAFGALAVLVSGSNQPLQLVVFGQLMDSFNGNEDKEEVRQRVFLFAGLYAALGVQQMVTNSVQTACFAKVAARQASFLRQAYFRALVRRPISWFDGQDPGALASSIMDKTNQVQVGIGDDLVKLIQQTLAFVIGLGVAFVFCWQVAAVAAAAVPVLAFVIGVANVAYGRATKGSNDVLDAATSTPLEAIGAIRTVQALGQERSLLEKYRGLCSTAAEHSIQMGRARAALEGTIAPIMFFMFGSCLWFGSSMIADDADRDPACRLVRFYNSSWELQSPDPIECVTGGSVMTAFLSVIFGFMGLLQGLPSLSSLAAAKTCGATIMHAIDQPRDAIDGLEDDGIVPTERPCGKIELSNVEFAYPARRECPVYSKLSLTIDAGKTVALAGPSGCGKSTLVALLERWYDVDGGAICVDGVDIRTLNVRWLRSQIGLVSQEPVLFSGSIGWNIGLGAGSTSDEGEAAIAQSAFGRTTEAAVTHAARLANAHSFVSEMPDGYATQVGDKGIQLSGGQKQRIAIARALVREPRILVLDEATSALDTESERIVQAALDALLKGSTRTTIVIAHRLSTIRNADKIAVFSGGRVVEEGPHEALLERKGGIYKSLVEAQLSSQPLEAVAAAPAASPIVVPGVETTSEAVAVGAVPELKALASEEAMAISPAEIALAVDKTTETKVKAQLSKTVRNWLWRQTRADVLWYAPFLIGACLTGLAMPASGFLMAQFLVVFYNVDTGEMRADARLWGGVFLGMGVVNAVGAISRQISSSIITERMVLRVRVAAFEAILRQPVGWFDGALDRTAGALSSRLATDCFQIKALTGERAGIAISQLAVLIGGLYISFDSSWRLTLCVFVIIPLTLIPVIAQAIVVKKYSERAAEALVAASSTASETLLQLRTVASFGLERHAMARFADELLLPTQQDVRKGIALGVGGGVAAGSILIGAAFQYIVGGAFFEADLIEFPDIMRCLLVLIFMAFGLAQVSRDASDRVEAMLAAGRVHAIIATKSPIDALTGSGLVPAERPCGKIELSNVEFAYPARRECPVYSKLSLTIDAGKTVALAGPSGCGKSTLVALLERWYDVDGGAICVDGVDIRTLNVRWLRSQIGLVSQEPVLFSGSIGWNIGLGAGSTSDEGEAAIAQSAFGRTTEAAVTHAARLANAHSFVSEMPDGYATQVGDKGIQLSGGQKQRIAIARALVREPRILVLDEATSALDTESERIVQAALDALLKGSTRTTIVIAHRLSTIRNADKIAVFSGGRVVEEGPHEALLERKGGIYKSLVVHSKGGSSA